MFFGGGRFGFYKNKFVATVMTKIVFIWVGLVTAA
jgi:hypothetical protein